MFNIRPMTIQWFATGLTTVNSWTLKSGCWGSYKMLVFAFGLDRHLSYNVPYTCYYNVGGIITIKCWFKLIYFIFVYLCQLQKS